MKSLFVSSIVAMSVAFVAQAASTSEQAWMQAAKSGDVAKLRELSEKEVYVNFQDDNGSTALLQATIGRQIAAVDFLCSLPAVSPTLATRQEGLSPLIAAVHLGFDEIAKALLACNALPDQADLKMQTSLIHAAKKGRADLVKLLVEAGADLEARDIFNRSAIDWAEAGGQTEALALLRQEANFRANSAAYLERENISVRASALREAARLGKTRLVRFLLRAGADGNETDEIGANALDYARFENHVATAELLKRSGVIPVPFARARIKTREYWLLSPAIRQQAFLAAIRSKDTQLTQLLISGGIPLTKEDVLGLPDPELRINPVLVALIAGNSQAVGLIKQKLGNGSLVWGEIKPGEPICHAVRSKDEEFRKAFATLSLNDDFSIILTCMNSPIEGTLIERKVVGLLPKSALIAMALRIAATARSLRTVK